MKKCIGRERRSCRRRTRDSSTVERRRQRARPVRARDGQRRSRYVCGESGTWRERGRRRFTRLVAPGVVPAERARARGDAGPRVRRVVAAFEHHHGSLDADGVRPRRGGTPRRRSGRRDRCRAGDAHGAHAQTRVPGPESRHGGAGEALRAAGRGVLRRRGRGGAAPGRARRAQARPRSRPSRHARPPPLRKGEVPPGAAAAAAAAARAGYGRSCRAVLPRRLPQLPKAPRPGNIPKLSAWPPPAPGSPKLGGGCGGELRARASRRARRGVRFAPPRGGPRPSTRRRTWWTR